MPKNPSAALLVLVVGAAAGGGISGCGLAGGEGAEESTAGDGAATGALSVYVVDGLDGRAEVRYYLRRAAGPEQRLLFDVDPELASGARVRVRGVETADGLRVLSFDRLPDPDTRTHVSPLINGTPYPPRTFAFVLVDIGGGVNLDAATATGRLISNPDSIRNYYLYDSFGRQDITAQVFGPWPYAMSGCDYSGVASTLRPMVTGSPQHYLWYFGSRTTACSWGGLGQLGTPSAPARDTWYNGSSSCVVLVQEPGHNFGMEHSSALRCGSAPFADTPTGSCTHSEYGDPFDPMGGGCRHMNAWQKAYQGWFGGCNGVTVNSSGTFTLLPIERRCDGVQYLKVPMPKARTFMRPADGGTMATNDPLNFYFVELRTPVDFDGTLGGRAALTPQVLIHATGEVRSRTQRGLHTYLLDMTPATAGSSGFADAALPVNQVFEDPAGGVSITVLSVSADQASVQVVTASTAASTCIDGSTFTPPGRGPDSCGAGGAMGSGGAPGTGGTVGTGGRPGSGGTPGTGGTTGSGGAGTGGSGTGGAPAGSGGAPGSGGVVGTGGRPGTGGATGTGGGQGSGGAAGTGGAPGTGGTMRGSGGAPGSGGGVGSGGAAGPGGSGSGGSSSGGSSGSGGATSGGGGSGSGGAGDIGGGGTTGTGGVIDPAGGAGGSDATGGRAPTGSGGLPGIEPGGAGGARSDDLGVVSGGIGGCACDLGSSRSPPWPGVAIALVLLAARSRRQPARRR
jgi:hypothetical protein